ncbi:MAG: sialidase family protein, partial [Gammaproteobacteria bacterium]
MTLRAATFGVDGLPISESLVDDLTCDCCQTDIALTPEGPVAVYRDRTTDEIRDIYVSRRIYGEWQPGVAVASDNWEIPACPVNGPVVRADGQAVVVAWFTAAADRPIVKVAWSMDSAKTFADPIQLDIERPLGHVAAALLSDGDLVVSWHRSAGEGGASLMLRRVTLAGKLGE